MRTSSHAPVSPSPVSPELLRAIGTATDRIPPLWPLRHFVAVNPFVGYVHESIEKASKQIERITGAAPLLAPQEYLALWDRGELAQEDLQWAVSQQPGMTVASLRIALERAADGPLTASLPTVADALDQERPRAHWSVFIAEEISKWCASYFDENQTTWRAPWRDQSLFAGWREAAVIDRNPEAFGLPHFRATIKRLPADPVQLIARAIQHIAPAWMDPADFLHRQLASIPGWAAFIQYRVREDRLRNRDNPLLVELLAIRLAYDVALYSAFSDDPLFKADWGTPRPVGSSERIRAMLTCQLAYEIGYQKTLARQLAVHATGGPESSRPDVQAVFCIDVRSEVFRRKLERGAPGVQTLGFAGFFGFPVAHRPEGAESTGARCPVLLVPGIETTDACSAASDIEARGRNDSARSWLAFQNSATSCFSFVETVGLAYAPALTRTRAVQKPNCRSAAPRLPDTLNPDSVAGIAEGALRNMSLVRDFARVVLICGHGSESANNPYASALDCGACGGHAGDVNARLATQALNRPDVRHRLAKKGIEIPDDTWFVAGLHHTTTDDVTLFDLDQAPASHAADLAGLKDRLIEAGRRARIERAHRLGLAEREGSLLDAAIRARAQDASQVRPEWGLANNAAFIAAPRSRTQHLDLQGRVFLHEYDHTLDPQDKVLELILCAPVVVASWINLQYFASRVDPQRYGSGNKVLHNVLGGLGVAEGNGGDLKVGLPLQSIHDGERFVHEPRRLTVFIEASRQRIDAVLARHPQVAALFDHGWLHLFSIEGHACYRRSREQTWAAGTA